MHYRTQEVGFGIILFLIGCALMFHTFDPAYSAMAQDINVGPMFFPRLLLGAWLCCALGIIIQALRIPDRQRTFLWGKVITAVLVLAGFVFFFEQLGFIVVGVLCFIGLSLVLDYKKIWILLAISCAYVLMTDFIFKSVLQIYLPTFNLFGA